MRYGLLICINTSVGAKKEFVMSKQVLKAGTSIGANLAEAKCAISRKEFLAKNYIAFKECSETRFWLDLLFRTEFISMDEYTSIISDCDVIYRILSSITKTLKNELKTPLTPNS